jgi:hypothetical protein
MENSIKTMFQSVLFNKFDHSSNLIAFLLNKFVLKRKLVNHNCEILSPKGTSGTLTDGT